MQQPGGAMMKLNLRLIAIAHLLLAITMGSGALHAADVAPDSLPKDFLGLADLRGGLSVEISALKDDIARLEKMPNDLSTSRADLDTLTREVDTLQKKPTPTPADFQDLRAREKQVAAIKLEIAEAESRQKTLTQKKGLLTDKQAQAALVQGKIAGMLSPDQSFKLWASGMFAILIGVVIVGFFLLTLQDKRILEAIFSGQAGIQFLTLFSLVIAIILFGIMGILEGKELSALLGGLSGYILGRGTGTTSKGTKDANDP
jgi:preprotein translocase subunit SecF